MPPRRARSVPPAPTVPPPLPDEPTLAGRLKSRFEAWHFLAGLAFIIATGGYAIATWDRGKATVEQLDAAKVSVTAQLGAAQGANAVQLGALQSQVQAQDARLASVEGRLELLLSLQQRLLDVSLATARATGARVPPDPSHPPSPGGTP